MPFWNELIAQLAPLKGPERGAWLDKKTKESLRVLSQLRGGRNVIFFGSAFLQKPLIPPYFVQITAEDINGLMSAMAGMNCSTGLTLVIHTPGGVMNATETLVEYLHQKFSDIEVVIPTYAMSAGTIISLAADRLLMGRQSQLGPIDPQMPVGGRSVSARAIVDQFEEAKNQILADTKLAAVWAPVLQSLGPALLTEAKDALEYGETMVARWLARRRFQKCPDSSQKAAAVANYFNRSDRHKSHGRRIDREEARSQDLIVEDIETNQELQDSILTTYHLATLIFEQSPCCKLIVSSQGKVWMKNMAIPEQPKKPAAPANP